MILLVPAYQPDDSLPALVRTVRARAPWLEVVVVDDGSDPAAQVHLAEAERAGALLLRHARNRGKGAALKSGFAWALRARPGEDVVTADADGQHAVDDILAVALTLASAGDDPRLVLGCRAFGAGTPLRSRVGNAAARLLFLASAGWTVSDTQTGLRGVPAALLPWLLTVPGERFEYEQRVLLGLRGAGHRASEVPIRTIYARGNASSHFRPVRDSLRVLGPFVAFAASSLLAFLLDTALLVLLLQLTAALVPAVVLARLGSAGVNLAINRTRVFPHARAGSLRRQILRYGLLAVALLGANIVWMSGLLALGAPLLLAKIVTEIALFLTSYGIQRGFVFRGDERVTSGKPAHREHMSTAGDMEVNTVERTPS